jgi:plasmid replication initiation protein
MKNGMVVKANKVVEASYRLSLNEQRLILNCIRQIKKGQEITPQTKFIIPALEFGDMYNIPSKHVYAELQKAAERLHERFVTIANPDPDDPSVAYTRTHWISSIDYKPQEGQLVLRFAYRIIPYIAMLESEFTRYNLEAVADMESIYGIRFYELFKCWMYSRTGGEKEIALEELKSILELKGCYASIKDFKLRVIEPAMRDINNHSDLQASYTQRKQGRRVSHLIFSFNYKPDQQPPKKLSKTDIERHAKPGESWDAAAKRLRAELKQQ